MASTTGKTYWDLTEKQRAELTDERVSFFERLELMEAGVLFATPFTPFTPEPYPDLVAPDVEVYDVGTGKYGATIGTFWTLDAAHRFMDLSPVPVESTWTHGSSIDHVGQQSDDGYKVSVRRIHSHAQWLAQRAAIEGRAGASKRNEELAALRDKEAAAETRALSSLREDLADCRAKMERYRRVVDTYTMYVIAAEGDEVMAARFLAKVFSVEEIATASAWHSVAIAAHPDVTRTQPAAAMSDAEPF